MRTRFAPSPTGPLHLGHAYSAMVAWDLAHHLGGECLLRIEDIDPSRARVEWEQQIFADLTWLGLSWPKPVLRQSENIPAYKAALSTLDRLGVLYPCTCTRRDIKDALNAPQEGSAPVFGPDGPVYPGTCKGKCTGHTNYDATLRLDMQKTIDILTDKTGKDAYSFEELSNELSDQASFSFADLPRSVGDIVVARRDFGTSYHLSVVVDDDAQRITHVVRGADLFDATRIHVVLQLLLGIEPPKYLHHRLVRDENGKRLAKRDDDRALGQYRAEGLSPIDIRHMVGLA